MASSPALLRAATDRQQSSRYGGSAISVKAKVETPRDPFTPDEEWLVTSALMQRCDALDGQADGLSSTARRAHLIRTACVLGLDLSFAVPRRKQGPTRLREPWPGP